MLVLTRKNREQIQIGDSITVTVLRVKGKSVRIGIEAPRDVRVLRTELPPEEKGQTISSGRVPSRDDGSASSENLDAWKPGSDSTPAQRDACAGTTTDADDEVLPSEMATLHLLIARRQRRRSVALAH